MDSDIAGELLCPVCRCQYCTETGDPRIISCGHCFCTDCLSILCEPSIYVDMIKCPECQNEDDTKDVNEFPVAFAIKELVSIVNEMKDEKYALRTPINHVTDDMGICEIHNSPIKFGCLNCEKWLCGTCVCLKHSGSHTKNCEVYPIDEALKLKKEEAINHLTAISLSFSAAKSEGKANIISANELKMKIVQHISLCEKYTKLFNNKELAFTEKLTYQRECEEVIAELTEALKSAQSSAELKVALSKCFEKKDLLEEQPGKHVLFNHWKHWISDMEKKVRAANSIFVEWKNWRDEETLWMGLSVMDNEVRGHTTFVDVDEYNELKCDSAFISYSNTEHFVFIEFSSSSTRKLGRITIQVEDNILARDFITRCCNGYFQNTKLQKPYTASKTFIFGHLEASMGLSSCKIGEKDQYVKPLSRGAVGIYNNYSNAGETVLERMVVYVNMDSGVPRFHNAHYITYSSEPKLQLCFGHVRSGINLLKKLTKADMGSIYISNCGLIVDRFFDSEEKAT